MLITLFGADAYERRRRLQTLLGQSERRRFGTGEDVSSMIATIGQADLFGQAVTVVLEDPFGLAVADQRRLAEHLPVALTSDQAVIVLSDIAPSKGELSEVLTRGQLEQFDLPTTASLVAWVQQQAVERHITAQRPTIPRFVLAFGGNKFSMASELARLQWSQPAELNDQTLSAMLPLGAEVTVFGLTDAWTQRKMAETLRQLQLLWNQQTSSQYVLAMLERQVRSLYVCQLLEGEATPARVSTAMGMPQFAAAKLLAAAKKWPNQSVARAMKNLYRADAAVKGGKAEPESALERWVVASLL